MSTLLINAPARLKAFRKRTGKKQAELADLLGVSTKTYQRYERGEFELPAVFVQQATDLLGLNPRWLFEGVGEMLLPGRGAQREAIWQLVYGQPYPAPGNSSDELLDKLESARGASKKSIDDIEAAANAVRDSLESIGAFESPLRRAFTLLADQEGVSATALQALAWAIDDYVRSKPSEG